MPAAPESPRYVRDNHLRVSTQKLPPYVSSDEDVAAICTGVLAAVAAVTTR